jgi:hypothetical protein
MTMASLPAGSPAFTVPSSTDQAARVATLLQVLAIGSPDAQRLGDELSAIRNRIAEVQGRIEIRAGESAVTVSRMTASGAKLRADRRGAQEQADWDRALATAAGLAADRIEPLLVDLTSLYVDEAAVLRLAGRYVPGSAPAAFDSLADSELCHADVIRSGVEELVFFSKGAVLGQAAADQLRTVAKRQDRVRTAALAYHLAAAVYTELATAQARPGWAANPNRDQLAAQMSDLAGRLTALARRAADGNDEHVAQVVPVIAGQVAVAPWTLAPVPTVGAAGSGGSAAAVFAAAQKHRVRVSEYPALLKACAAHPGREDLAASLVARGRLDSEIEKALA